MSGNGSNVVDGNGHVHCLFIPTERGYVCLFENTDAALEKALERYGYPTVLYRDNVPLEKFHEVLDITERARSSPMYDPLHEEARAILRELDTLKELKPRHQIEAYETGSDIRP